MYLWFWRRFDKYRNHKWHYLTGWAVCMQTAVKHIRRKNPWWMVWQNIETATKCIWCALTEKGEKDGV